MSTIAVIGTGRMGVRLAEQLVLDRACDELWLWNRSRPKLYGTLLSLQIWADLLRMPIQIREVNWPQIGSADVVVIVVKDAYDPRTLLRTEKTPPGVPLDLRHIGIARDLPLVQEVCNRLQGFSGKVAVITNPVDIMSSCVARWMPSARVVGLGLTLDAARLAFSLEKRMGTLVCRHGLILGGEHGAAIVPLTSMWNKTCQSRVASRRDLTKGIEECVALGFRIVEDLGYTVHDCAVVFSEDIKWLLAKAPSRRFASFSIWDENASIGWPVELAPGGMDLMRYSAILESEKQAIRQARDHIATILHALKVAMPLSR